jgi:hypothetical protein
MDFRADAVVMGEQGSSLQLAEGRPVVFRVQAAARLDPQPQVEIQRRKFNEQPYWHIERARIGTSRKVPVELIENGSAVARLEIEADGTLQPIEITHPVKRSGWYALRILPSSHTNPIFIEVGGRPIRERQSLQWCLDSVEQCWKQKERFFTGAEHGQAVAAFDHARQEYRSRLAATGP